MAKINEFLKNKIRNNRIKKIERIENNLEKGKFNFVLINGIILWSPIWLLSWFLLLDLKIFNYFLHQPLKPINEIFSDPLIYFASRLPFAIFLGYTNAVSHWHYLHRRLRILKKKISRDNE